MRDSQEHTGRKVLTGSQNTFRL